MKTKIPALLATLILSMGIPAMAQVSMDIHVGGPTVVAPPQVVVPAAPVYAGPVVEYRYYPGWNVYLDPVSGLYWSLQRGTWVLGGLPRHVPPGQLGRYVVVPAEEGRPWHHVDKRYYNRHEEKRERHEEYKEHKKYKHQQQYEQHEQNEQREHHGRGW